MIRMEQIQNNQPETYIDAQIRKLKDAGVTFEKCTEREAREYMADKCSPYKVAAYAKLFDVHDKGEHKGEYVDLDFYQLKYLADIDQQLREILLAMTLDIEHFCKTRLITECAVTEEDGYRIMVDYMNDQDDRQRKYIKRELERHKSDPYTKGVIETYDENLPLWAFVEVMPFGTIVGLIRYCGEHKDDGQMVADYFVLRSIKTLRNACAHNSCILLDLHSHTGDERIAPHEITRVLTALGISKRARQRWLQTVPTAQIASLLYLYSEIVPAGSTRKRRLGELHQYLTDIEKDSVLLADNPARAALTFVKSLTEPFNLLD